MLLLELLLLGTYGLGAPAPAIVADWGVIGLPVGVVDAVECAECGWGGKVGDARTEGVNIPAEEATDAAESGTSLFRDGERTGPISMAYSSSMTALGGGRSTSATRS
jgi:hypothetical protein